MKRRGIIEFNHISNKLSEEEINKLEKLYLHYHKPAVCYKWKYKRLKRIKILLDVISLILALVGGITGGITLNPVILGTISGSGLLVQMYVKKSGIERRIEGCKMAEKDYEKLLSCLKGNIRGIPYDESTLLSHLKEVDDFISSNCPSFDGVVKKYNRKYVTHNLQSDSQ